MRDKQNSEKIITGRIYKLNRPPFDRSKPEFCYFHPATKHGTGPQACFHGWLVDKHGNRHHSFEFNPIIVEREFLGKSIPLNP